MNTYEFDKRISQLENDVRTLSAALRELVQRLKEKETEEPKRGPGRPRKEANGDS